jgi:hypothetical protein
METHEGDVFLANMDPTIGAEIKKKPSCHCCVE